MVTWECLFLSANGHVQGRLNELGAEGWELVAIHVEQYGADRRFECVLKRPKDA